MSRRILSLLLAAAMVLCLAGCGAEPSPTKPAETTAPTVPAPSGEERYLEARKPFDTAKDLKLEIVTDTQTTVGQETFDQKTNQTLELSGIGTAGLQVQLTETVSVGSSEDIFKEFYTEGTMYTTVVNTYHFKGEMEAEDYLERFAPAVLLDAALYGSITGNDTTIQFSDPRGPEKWAMPEDGQFITASGTAELDAAGALTKTTYEITYVYGSTQVTKTTTVTPTIPESLVLTAPPKEGGYLQVEDVDAIRLYDIALLYLFDSGAVTSVATETIVSQAAACVLTIQNKINFHGTGSDHVSEISQDINQVVQGQTSAYSLKEQYRDGTYTYIQDGGTPQTDTLSAANMLSYVQGYLGENITALDYFSQAEITDVGGQYFLELDFNEEYGTALNHYICSSLFQQETFLDDLASAYVTTDSTGYMAIDKYTGFPTAVGIAYAGSHTIDGVEYPLSLQADQSFLLASPTAYETVTGEPLPEEEPETPAQPLLYHVTGDKGQEMWLFGTVHVGDSRTGFLPQELYDAFDASDALAVEFDIQAFEEKAATDASLVNQLAPLYFYTDGTTTKDYLEQEDCQEAGMLLKASGNYNANAELMKPILWSQSIENFYIQQGYDLLTQKGADNRLLDRAKEQGKKILDIESGLAQLQMFTGFSQELQALLLESTLDYSSAEYCAELKELYEAWCTGDEAALRVLLDAEMEDVDEEDLPLVEEYNKAMCFDRNTGMHDAAVKYLESGETIFYAVGLAHLLDSTNGLVDTLRAAGYTVEQVKYA